MTTIHRSSAALLASAAFLFLAACGQSGGEAPAPGAAPSTSNIPPGKGLTGETRDQFIKGAVISCTQKGAIDPATAGIASDKIAAYCECSAKALADRLSMDDINTINADPSKASQTMAPVIQAAAQACQSTLGR